MIIPERKKKKSFFDIFDFGEENFLFDDRAQSGGSGYSISVNYDEQGRPVIRAKVHGDINVNELRKDLERYPDARIEGLDEKSLIRIVGNEEEMKKKKEDKPKEIKEV